MKYLMVCLLIPLLANAGSYPCGGKKGGMKSCTSEGKFICNDGSLSLSKRLCVDSRNVNQWDIQEKINSQSIEVIYIEKSPLRTQNFTFSAQ